MKSSGQTALLWGLGVLNAGLLTGLFFRPSVASPAYGQAGPIARAGDYVMVPGQVANSINDVVYVLDQTNRQLTALVYDDSAGRVQAMKALDLDAVFNARGTRGPGR